MSACVPWTGRIDRDGYGRTGKSLAHRVAYEQAVGPIPAGLDLDHTCHDRSCVGGPECRHRRCVNPEHLEPVTRRENTRRGLSPVNDNAAKTHCVRDHEFDDENTYPMPSGGRRCRKCAAIHAAEYRARRSA